MHHSPFSAWLVRIPDDKIDQIREATDIVEYIGSFVRLKKRGKDYVGLCPFHTEKTPSFTVSAAKQMFHCFGCGVGGNVFTFVMERDKVSFVEAVRMLAERAGVALPAETPEASERAGELEQLYEIMRDSGLFYHEALTRSKEGEFALSYFRTTRGFTDDTIRSFGLGYAPNTWDAYWRHAQEKGYPPAMLERCGLLRRRDDGTYYDYFRGRAMFPVFSASGRTIAFGARKLREDDPLGKYINSPETPVYVKSRVLYGLFQAKEAIRESGEAILVEGYADLITVFQAGIKNIVASSGTALTSEQAQLLKRYGKAIVIVYDADSAGSKAALRGVDILLQHDLDVRVVALPEGDDPDTFVRSRGGAAFREMVTKALSFIDFLAGTFEAQGAFATPEGQTRAVRTIVRMIANMSDDLKRNFYIKDVADKFKLYESTLHRELERALGERSPQRATYPQKGARGVEEPKTAVDEAGAPVPQPERDLLHAILDGGGPVARFAFEHIDLEDLRHPATRRLATLLLERLQGAGRLDASELVQTLESPEDRRLIAEIVFERYHVSKRWAEREGSEPDTMRIAADALKAIVRSHLEEMKAENQRLLRDASHRGDDVLPYMERDREISEELRSLDLAFADLPRPDNG